MRDLYDRMIALSRQLAIVVSATEIGDHNEKLAATSIELPAHVFDHLSQQMAFVQDDWPQGTSFEPLKGEMRFNWILVKPGVHVKA